MAERIVAVRGAASVAANRADAIVRVTADLLRALLERNRLSPEQVVSAIFTTTPDLDADFPARAARELGWLDVPLLGATEMGVPGAPPRIVRVLLTVRQPGGRGRLMPVYQGEAARLRPDLREDGTVRARARSRAGEARTRVIGIVGLGQIGGSMGLALAGNRGWRRVGWDRNPRTLRRAFERGALDEAAPALAALCARADVVVLAVPADALPVLIERCASLMRRGALLMDTGSARRALVPAMRRAAERGVRVAGAHPLAGNEGRGLASARASLFVGATLVLHPVARAVPAIARRLARDLGARPVVVGAGRHDAALARTSHLPYVIACALARLGEEPHRRGLSGPGFRGMTRLAASDPRVARAYVAANLDRVRGAWRGLARDVEADLRALARVQSPPRTRTARRG